MEESQVMKGITWRNAHLKTVICGFVWVRRRAINRPCWFPALLLSLNCPPVLNCPDNLVELEISTLRYAPCTMYSLIASPISTIKEHLGRHIELAVLEWTHTWGHGRF